MVSGGSSKGLHTSLAGNSLCDPVVIDDGISTSMVHSPWISTLFLDIWLTFVSVNVLIVGKQEISSEFLS